MKKEVEVLIPRVPNFINAGKEMVPIGEFTDDELEKIGREWTANLLEKARKTRIVP